MARDLLEIFLRDLNRLYQTHRMYPAGHEQIASAAELAARALRDWGHAVRMSFVGDDLLVEDRSAQQFGDRLKALTLAFRAAGWEGVRIEQECGASELLEWLDAIRRGEGGSYSGKGVHAGRLGAQMLGTGRTVVQWPEGYSDYGPDVQSALSRVGQADPAGLELARGVVENIFIRMDSGERLLTTARRLKAFDEYTYTHALNVSIVTLSMAKRLGSSPKTAELVALAALFHDVGKERLPLEILHKPDSLTPEERELVNRHPVDGASILLALQDDVHPLLPAVAFQHHIGADGSGYPTAHPRNVPHPVSHLVAAADTFDAMRTIRPYGGPFTEERAVTVILNKLHRGALEPLGVSALFKVLGVLDAGTRVELAGGILGAVFSSREDDFLRPLIQTDAGGLVDLRRPDAPRLVAVREWES